MTDAGLSIGAVARIVGLSPHALRKWEIRYGAVRPRRSPGGDRRYSKDDVDRLATLKALIDHGHAISSLASLSGTELDQLLLDAGSSPEIPGAPLRLAVVGDPLLHELQQAASRMPNVEVESCSDAQHPAPEQSAQAVVIELGHLGTDTRSGLAAIRERFGIDRVVVIYGFGSITAAEQLSDDRTALVRRPLNAREFARTVTALLGTPAPEASALGLPPHRFTREQLSRLAMISPQLECECPRHVSQVLIELGDFERYSAECEITKPADAAIHNLLRRTAATSRALFERALVELAEAEGIDLENA